LEELSDHESVTFCPETVAVKPEGWAGALDVPEDVEPVDVEVEPDDPLPLDPLPVEPLPDDELVV
jgi:hypothetical protein